MPAALGIIETDSLIGALEAANTMAKNFNIFLAGKESLTNGIVALKLIGEYEDVKSALTAAEEAVKKLEKKIYTHIIKDPEEQLLLILPEINNFYFQFKKAKPEKKEEKVKIIEPALEKISTENSQENQNIIEPAKKVNRSKPKEKVIKKIAEKIKQPAFNYGSDTIARLRKEALGLLKPVKKEKDIVPENKEEHHNRGLQELNVHHLRRLARNTKNFPIKGREISRANREVLLNYFKQLD